MLFIAIQYFSLLILNFKRVIQLTITSFIMHVFDNNKKRFSEFIFIVKGLLQRSSNVLLP